MNAQNIAKGLMVTCIGLVASMVFASTDIPKGTPVELTFDQRVNSRYAHVGDQVRMHVSHDVIVDGRDVLHAGTPVVASIEKIRKNERFGINANMRLYIHDVNGIPLVPRTRGKDSGSRPDHAALAAGAGALILGPIGLLGSYFVVGKPMIIKEGSHMETMVADDTVIH